MHELRNLISSKPNHITNRKYFKLILMSVFSLSHTLISELFYFNKR